VAHFCATLYIESREDTVIILSENATVYIIMQYIIHNKL